MKKFLISFVLSFSLMFSVVSAGILVKKVYFSSFPIIIDGENYSSETPILTYQNRTYVALREFSEMVNVGVNFEEGKIIIDTVLKSKTDSEGTKVYLEDKTIEQNNIVVKEKIENDANEELSEGIRQDESEKENVSIEDDKNRNDSSDEYENVNRIVYISKSGSKYHVLEKCSGGTYYLVSLSEAISDGYAPCLKCANSNIY